jgi:hypothetical protein
MHNCSTSIEFMTSDTSIAVHQLIITGNRLAHVNSSMFFPVSFCACTAALRLEREGRRNYPSICIKTRLQCA